MTTHHSALRVLFFCPVNSCRSHMAQAFARQLWPETIHAYSAGLQRGVVDPVAAKVMAELNIELDDDCINHVDDVVNARVDVIVPCCEPARQACNLFKHDAIVVPAQFNNPTALASQATSYSNAISIYRRVRDEIHAFVESLPRILSEDCRLPSTATESAQSLTPPRESSSL